MILRGQVEGIDAQGGALVNPATENAILARRNVVGVARRNSRVVNMASDVQSVPRRTTDIALSFVAEGAALPESSETLDNVSLTAKKAAGIIRRSSELEEDEIEAEASDFVGMCAYALASKEDDCAFNGDGSATYGRMRGLTTLLTDSAHTASKVSAGSGHSTFATIDASDLGALIAALPSYALLGAKWYASPYAIGVCFARLGAVSGAPVGPNGRPFMSYLGWPIEVTDRLPGNVSLTNQAAIIFGDLSLASTLGSRRGLRIRRLGERFADSDQVGYQISARFHFVCHDLGNNTAAGAVVGLVGG